ncbi:B12-binding domain-containing radical SAM protein [Nanoarchaeota archaeon]
MSDIVLLGLEQNLDKEGITSQNEECEFIGIEYVSAYANQHGLKTKVLHKVNSVEDVLQENPKLVGLSVMVSNYDNSREFSKAIKKVKPDTKIIWGGPHASNYYEELLKERSVDYIVLGEGEKSFSKLANSLMNFQETNTIEGIAFFDGLKIHKNTRPLRLTSKELNSIDFSVIHNAKDYSKFYAKQIPHTIPNDEMNFAMVVGSRGCWNDCSFCSSNSIWGRSITRRSPENIVDEIEFLVNDKDINFIFFGDDDFLINGNWANNISNEINKRKIDVNYHVMASVRSASKFNSFDSLKESGCCEITIGMETTNQQILDSIGKGYEVHSLIPVANEITSNQIHLGLYYMLGYPEQTSEDLKRDHEFIQTIPFSRIRAVFLTPYPGTRLYDEIDSKGLWLEGCRNNFSHYTCDQPVIKSVASPEELVEARKNVLSLYFSDEYHGRMKKIYKGNPKSEKAFHGFQSFMKGVLK